VLISGTVAVWFVDGKIFTEHVNFDATAMNAQFADINAMAEAESEMTDDIEE